MKAVPRLILAAALLVTFAVSGLAVSSLVLPSGARAYDNKKPEPTKPIFVAMTWEKFATKDRPDFSQWVQHTPEYMNAELWERPDLVQKNSEDLKNTYNLLTGLEPLIVSIHTRISVYSRMGHGFLVQNFDNRDYFNYEYLGRRYALIPKGIETYQWMKAPAAYEPEVMRETKNGHDANIVITMTPIAADPNPMQMGKHKYNLLMAEVSKIELWSQDGTRVVWDDTMNAPASTRSKLLNMYQ